MVDSRRNRVDEICFRIAASQYGLFNRAQARAAGLTNETIRDRVRRGRTERILPGVFAIAGSPSSWDRDLMAAILWAGEEAAASFRAAAAKRGFQDFEGAPIEISTTNIKNCGAVYLPSGNRVIVHRVDRHLLPEIEYVGEVPVTSMRRTLLDLVGIGHRRAEGVLDAACRRGLTNVGQLWLYIEQEWMRGRRGVGRMKDLLTPRTDGRAPTEGELELMMRGLIYSHGLPEPVHQFPVSLPSGDIRIDFAYPDALLAIEVDGYIWHMDREAFERDRQRDNELRARGWTVLRFTWAMLRFDSPRVVALILRCLE